MKTLPARALPSGGSWKYAPQDGELFHFSRKAKPEEKRLGYMNDAEILKAVREVFPNARIID
jgi:hypothetical protein